LAVELAPIRVNCVAPSVVHTNRFKDYTNEVRNSVYTAWQSSNPLKKIGTPMQVAEAVLWLLSSNYTTGIVIPMNGGGHLL